ncbi:MAG TPA: alpha/beta hydrolase [Chitinophagaceae bacterium]|nr:alpha/beta hydrolase [Chitinophagaceae bacterium]
MRNYWLLLCVFFVACQKNDLQDPGGSVSMTILNVSYGNDAAQKMDVYLPANRDVNNTRVVIMLHGGAWISGDKTDFNPYADSMKRRLPDFAIFNINYRLSSNGNNTFPAQEMDVKAAFDFIYSKKNEYAISDKIVLIGASAGAHLALLQGYKYSSPVKVKAIVDFFGPTDINDLYYNPPSSLITPSLIASIVGGTPLSHPDLYHDSSPINFAGAQSPPTLIFQGGLDPLVSVSQSTSLRDILQSSGIPHQYVFYPDEGHGWEGATLSDSFDKIQAFLAIHVP